MIDSLLSVKIPTFFIVITVGVLAHSGCSSSAVSTRSDGDFPHHYIGYSEYRTNSAGGRFANQITTRACMVRADGTGYRRVAEELLQEPYAWTQFAGWSPDGNTAIIGRGWESPENAAWEEEHREFRMTEGWLYDMYLLDLKTGHLENLTAIDRVSIYNTGLFFWPNDPNKLGFQAIIDGQSHPFSMDRDGHNKVDLTSNAQEFAYGFSASPDGRRIAYHQNYQIYLANADGSQAMNVETGFPFNFVPQWSPDGKRLMFLSGEHYNCHPYIVSADGTGLRQIANRNGYRGVVEFLDVYDFHGGSSDVPVWSPDGKWIYYTAHSGESVELFRVDLNGQSTQLTHSPAGSLNYHPKPSPDGKWLVFGSNRSGVRQLYVMRHNGQDCIAITHVSSGWGAMWAHWQP